MGKIHEAIESIQLKFFALRYGEEEAQNLVRLKGKDRAKRLALLDVHGEDTDAFIAAEEKRISKEEAYKVVSDQILAEAQVRSDEHLVAVFEEALRSDATTDLMRDYYVDERAKASARLRENRSRLMAAEEAKKRLIEEEGTQLTTEETPHPRMLPLAEVDVQAFQARLHGDIKTFYEKIVGGERVEALLRMDRGDRLQALREQDFDQSLGSARAIEDRVLISREAALSLITTKNRIQATLDRTRLIVNDISQDTDEMELREKAARGARILAELTPIRAEAQRAIEESKEALGILETRLGAAYGYVPDEASKQAGQ